jgi:hypothetical protein
MKGGFICKLNIKKYILNERGMLMTVSHALVVGGTGMLREVSIELARRGHVVTVVGRRKERLSSLARDAESRAAKGIIHPVAVDWHDTQAFSRGIEQAVSMHGPIRLAVVWIHGSAPEAPFAAARLAGSPQEPCRWFHVLGSSAADPSRPDDRRRARFAAIKNIQYHEVILGFVLENGRSRWLTNEEISGGVLRAIDIGSSRFVVGTVKPWSARPGW